MIDDLRIGRRTVAGESHGEISAKRTAATDAIVNSDSDKRLIIAGPWYR
jgi:hypothetical protein